MDDDTWKFHLYFIDLCATVLTDNERQEASRRETSIVIPTFTSESGRPILFCCIFTQEHVFSMTSNGPAPKLSSIEQYQS